MRRYIYNAWLIGMLISTASLFAASAPTDITGPTIITAEGIYIVADPIAAPGIQVSSPAVNVDINLNGYAVSGVVIDPGLDNITIRNGTAVGASPAIDVQGGTNIFIKDMLAKDAIGDVGIHFANVLGGEISNCTMTQNSTGLELEDCAKIVIDNCVARCNTNAGFCLIQSTTCCITECKALSIGEGNTQEQDATIAGFISTDGYGNIFERCIANSTQALSTTDSNSLVSGFTLRGAEQCTKIIDCESANAHTNENGMTVPHGILLEATVNNPATFTAFPAVPAPTGFISSVAWSPDGKYLAAADKLTGMEAGEGLDLLIYEFDRATYRLLQVADSTPNLLEPEFVEWHPDGRFLSVADNANGIGEGQGVAIFEFSPKNNELSFITTAPQTPVLITPNSAPFSSDGRYVAVADFGGTVSQIVTGSVLVYEFDPVEGALNFIDDAPLQAAFSVAWRPDNKFIAAIGHSTVFDDGRLAIFQFNGSDIIFRTQTTTGLTRPFNVKWSPDGKYIALGDRESDVLRVYSYNEQANELILHASVSVLDPHWVSWSSDSKYIAVDDDDDLLIYEFDRGSSQLNFVSRGNIPMAGMVTVDWSPDGQFVAAGSSIAGGALGVYEVLAFPSNNVIKDNTVYCNSGGVCPSGIGISGSTIQNLIIGNTAYNNPSNFAYATNVFNEQFGQGPSDVQNISIQGCVPICMPDDLVLLAKQIWYKACGVTSQLDQLTSVFDGITVSGVCDVSTVLDLFDDSQSLLCSKIDLINASINAVLSPVLDAAVQADAVLCSKLNAIKDTLDGLIQSAIATPCSPTAITTATDLDMPDMIYCVANTIGGAITISADNIVLDLNGYRIAGGIEIASGVRQVIIKNGTVQNLGGSAILANSGARDIRIENVTARNAHIGINCDGVVGGVISNCEMTQNITGIELDHCANITIDNCAASCNTNAGFCLLQSSTCCITECKALSIGEGNAQTADALVAGFISSDGYGNIFERCIANSTQALSTTDYNSLVAGFALRGSEGCTKIIECESANATTSETGLTVPYGIFLESSLNIPITLTTRAIGSTVLDVPEGANWSPDGKYVLISDSGTPNVLIIYEFDYQARILQEVTTQTGPTVLSSPHSARWSPDGLHIATIDTAEDVVLVYEFDATARKLSEIASIAIVSPAASVDILAWSPDGRYIGALTAGGSPSLIVYEFNAVEGTLTELVSIGGLVGPNSNSVDWRPDGRYISVTDSGGMRVYSFDPGSASLSLVVSESNAAITADWSPNGKYLAVSDFPRLAIYEFDAGSASLVRRVQTNVGIIVVTTRWSPDGRYIACADTSSSVVRIFEFDPATVLLTQVATDSGIALSSPGSSNWSPDGSYITVVDSVLNQVFVYEALSFPSKNVIKNNTVYCNSGGRCPSGVGISGSSIQNLIIGNTSYSNPLLPDPSSASGRTVSSNYQFVTNVFNPLFGQAPTDLQNISIGSCEPICMPEDLALLSKQILYKVCVPLPSQLDVVESKIASIYSCVPNGIIASATLTTPDTIYCVGNAITDGPITISANNIEVDLNGYCIEDGIVISSNVHNVVIRNGTVENAGGNAISANSGARAICIEDVTARNADIGISFDQVVGGQIIKCKLMQNTTGLKLDTCANIAIDNCVASGNTQKGFSLISSTTNCVRDCKALNTANQTADNITIGFEAQNGSGNIFEQCIANGTFSNETEYLNAFVAGFALRGTERCSKIIDCEAANSQTVSNSLTVPYGILLQAQLDEIVPAAAITESEGGPDEPEFAVWSSDGKYIAVADSGAADALQVYRFDRVQQRIDLVSAITSSDTGGPNNIGGVVWSPDGQYLAVVDSFSPPALRIYRFNRSTESLSFVDAIVLESGNFIGIDWSPDGQYLAVFYAGASRVLQIYQFDRYAEKISFFAQVSVSISSFVTPSDIVRWSPDGKYVALAIGRIRVYEFDRASETISFFAQSIAIGLLQQIDWSPDGKYIVECVVPGGLSIQVYEFDPAAASISFVDSNLQPGNAKSVKWSPDGRYVAVADTGLGGKPPALQVYEFDRSASSIDFVDEITDSDPGGPDVPQSADWSPDGTYIAVSDMGSPDALRVYDALTFPSKNVITGNTVYCNSGGSCPQGVGVSGSSIENMIIGNTSYSNPIPRAEFEPIVSSNYQFVTNVFNSLFGQAPSALQNISLDGCAPICMPVDLALLEKQILFQVISRVDASCAPEVITQSTTLATADTLYCVANAIADGPITISADNIAVDLNGYRIEDGIIISSGVQQAVIKNGVVENSGGNAILAHSGARDIRIENVLARNAVIGINFDGVVGGKISNCTMTQNSTGVELTNSAKITIDKCIASYNTNAGYCLITSTTCCVTECKALSTGEGNANILNQTVAGFVSTNGNANIFERCIANATQALSTTDSQSLVAGFALRGSESCTKIIECEAANTQTNQNGVTVPYGILLEAQFANLQSVASVKDFTLSIRGLEWSPDGKYVAVAPKPNSDDDPVFVYRFERKLENLVLVAEGFEPIVLPGGDTDAVGSVDWSLDGRYLAVGILGENGVSTSNNYLVVYSWESNSESLTKVQALNPGDVISMPADGIFSAKWSLDGNYLAVGGGVVPAAAMSEPRIFLYRFDKSTQTLSFLQAINPGGVTGGAADTVRSVDWSPDGSYLAVGTQIDSLAVENLFTYRFDRGTESLTLQQSINPGGIGSIFDGVRSVEWSPDGKYLLVGGVFSGGSDEDLFLYQLNVDTGMLAQIEAISPGGTGSDGVYATWSPDGKYLAVSGQIYGSVQGLFIYEFDRGILQLIQLQAINPGGGSSVDIVQGLDWSPDGSYLAIGGSIDASGGVSEDLIIYEVLSFVSANVIKNNIVYCNSGGACPQGVGISGSSIANLIIGNMAYSNPVPQGANEPIVSSNYQFVTNVFNSLFGQAPSDLQNISVPGCEPICMPCDLCLLLKQNKAQMDTAESKIDLLLAAL